MMRKNLNIRTFLFLFLFSVLLVAGYCLYKKIYNLPVERLKIGIIYPKEIKTKSMLYGKFESHFEQARQKIHDDFLSEEKKLRSEFESLKKTGRKII